MATFSGTALPPVVRLGGSADPAFAVESGTSVAWLSKQFLFPLRVPVTSPLVKAIQIPQTKLTLRRHPKRRRRHR